MTEKLRITTTDRTNLRDVIPLSTPYLVFIDPSNVCNQQCTYCPTGDHELIKKIGRKNHIMDLEMFKKIIDQFNDFPDQVKTLRLYKDGEPLLNPDFCKMVRYAKESGLFKSIDTTTNGTILDESLIRDLISSGIDKIFLSVPINYTDEYVRNITWLYLPCNNKIEIFAKIAGDFITKEQQDIFMKIFTPITDSCAIEHTAPCWPGYDCDDINTEVGIYGQPVQEDILVCPYVFYSLSINSNGTVSHCFVDWKNDFLLGDLTKTTVKKVWDGGLLRWIRISMLLGNRYMIRNCGTCQHHMYGQPDNIDDFRDELFVKLMKPVIREGI